MGFDIKWERIQDILVAIVLGRVDGGNADEFQRALAAGIQPADQALLLDFERVAYVSSAGLRAVVVTAKQFNVPGKQFGLCALTDSVREIVAVSGFDKVISTYESRDAAIGGFGNN